MMYFCLKKVALKKNVPFSVTTSKGTFFDTERGHFFRIKSTFLEQKKASKWMPFCK